MTTEILHHKECSKCKQAKDIVLFKTKNKLRADGTPYKQIQSTCKPCWRKHYSGKKSIEKTTRAKPRLPNKKRPYTIKLIARNRTFIKEYLSNNHCIDCGVLDWRVLEFDHLPEFTKSKNVCEMMQCSIENIQEEIAKCEVVCSNCHSLRTFARVGSWRMEQ